MTSLILKHIILCYLIASSVITMASNNVYSRQQQINSRKGIEYLRDKSLVRSPEMMKLNLETKSNLNKEISKFTLKNEARGLISPHFTYNIALVQQVNEFKDILVKLFDLIDPLDILTLSILM